MAVSNRLTEWYWIFSTRVLKREMLWRPPNDGTSDRGETLN
jgi:hypothetical protein